MVKASFALSCLAGVVLGGLVWWGLLGSGDGRLPVRAVSSVTDVSRSSGGVTLRGCSVNFVYAKAVLKNDNLFPVRVRRMERDRRHETETVQGIDLLVPGAEMAIEQVNFETIFYILTEDDREIGFLTGACPET